MRKCEACGGPTKSRGSKKFLGPLRFFCGKPECQKEKYRLLSTDYDDAQLAFFREREEIEARDREFDRRWAEQERRQKNRPGCGDPACDDEHGDLPIIHWFF